MSNDEKAKKLLKAILNCGFAIGEAYSIRAIYNSGMKPWYKWNLIAVLATMLPKAIMDGFKSIEEFWECLDDEPSEEETPATEET